MRNHAEDFYGPGLEMSPFHSHSIGWNSVMWPYLTAREPEKHIYISRNQGMKGLGEGEGVKDGLDCCLPRVPSYFFLDEHRMSRVSVHEENNAALCAARSGEPYLSLK